MTDAALSASCASQHGVLGGRQTLSNLGVRFSEPGRPAEAVAPAQEAVAIWREPAATYPDRYRADLATSLRRLAAMLDGLGRATEAEDVRRQATQMTQL